MLLLRMVDEFCKPNPITNSLQDAPTFGFWHEYPIPFICHIPKISNATSFPF